MKGIAKNDQAILPTIKKTICNDQYNKKFLALRFTVPWQ